jgi:hypothetical protein
MALVDELSIFAVVLIMTGLVGFAVGCMLALRWLSKDEGDDDG